MTHEHKFFLFETKAAFEPIDLGTGHDDIYQRIEYAIMACNCGEVIKRKVKNEE
jgi:hypothetical protein